MGRNLVRMVNSSKAAEARLDFSFSGRGWYAQVSIKVTSAPDLPVGFVDCVK